MEKELTAVPQGLVISPEHLDLARKTVFPGASKEMFELFLYDCARQGVNPLDRLIHPQIRNSTTAGVTRQVYTAITSIDLMRIRAAETGECLGISDPVFTGAPKADDFAATVTVKRLINGHVAEFTATARWKEYVPKPGQDIMWVKMPFGQLGKCAEALALRKGFPKSLHGLYAKEELEARHLDEDGSPVDRTADEFAKDNKSRFRHLRAELIKALTLCKTEEEWKKECVDFQKKNGMNIWTEGTLHNNTETFRHLADQFRGGILTDIGQKAGFQDRIKEWKTEMSACNTRWDFLRLEGIFETHIFIKEDATCLALLRSTGEGLGFTYSDKTESAD